MIALVGKLKSLKMQGIDSFHIDIMDGEFVDNFGMGYQDMKFITGATSKEVDVHLMVNKPHNYLGNAIWNRGWCGIYSSWVRFGPGHDTWKN